MGQKQAKWGQPKHLWHLNVQTFFDEVIPNLTFMNFSSHEAGPNEFVQVTTWAWKRYVYNMDLLFSKNFKKKSQTREGHSGQFFKKKLIFSNKKYLLQKLNTATYTKLLLFSRAKSTFGLTASVCDLRTMWQDVQIKFFMILYCWTIYIGFLFLRQYCYQLVQLFMVTCFIAGQNSEWLDQDVEC